MASTAPAPIALTVREVTTALVDAVDAIAPRGQLGVMLQAAVDDVLAVLANRQASYDNLVRDWSDQRDQIAALQAEARDTQVDLGGALGMDITKELPKTESLVRTVSEVRDRLRVVTLAARSRRNRLHAAGLTTPQDFHRNF